MKSGDCAPLQFQMMICMDELLGDGGECVMFSSCSVVGCGIIAGIRTIAYFPMVGFSVVRILREQLCNSWGKTMIIFFLKTVL